METKRLNLITKHLFRLIQTLYDNKINHPYHLTELEGKYFRFGLANISNMNLIRNHSFELLGREVPLHDFFSLKSLTRMQIESFSLMFYLFFDDVEENEKSFRYDVYKLHGLQKQMKR